jgi:putative transcriptional regulator|nr:MAG TPA: Cro/C1-type HTH DNA-binding domain protein [Caudoviricetes sp.]
MKVCYNKLWKQLIDKNMKKKDLRELASISSSSIAKLGHNDFVSLEVLVKICEVLQCDIGDIIEVIPNEQK